MTLPRGWVIANIGDLVVDRVRQGEPTTRAVPYIDIGSIDRERKTIGETQKVTSSTAPTRARQWVNAGDVLVSMTRPNLNAVALVPEALDGAVASTGFDVLRSLAVVPDWIYYRVRSQAFVQDVCADVQGVVYPAIRPADVRRHELPIPPAAEQRRIVEALESYLSRLDSAVATLEATRSKLNAYRASVLKAAVEGRVVPTEAVSARQEGRSYEPADVLLERILKERRRRWEEAELAKLKSVGKTTKDDRWRAKYEEPKSLDTRNLPELPEGWCWATADAVGEILLGRRRAPEYMGTARPYLRVANVRDDHLDLSDVKEMPFDDRHGQKYLVHPGDILVSEGQSPELVGQSAIYRGGVDGLCFQATLHRFRAVPGGPTPEFSQIVFRAHLRTGVFRTVASITTNIAHLTLEKFQESRFPLPPTAEQERIVLETESRLSVADAIEKQMSTELSRIARLRQAILKWGFEGKLVDQDPNDELAETLLARVRAERAAVPAKKANSRRRGAA